MEVPCEACGGPGSGMTARENGLRASLLSSAVWKAALMDACLSLEKCGHSISGVMNISGLLRRECAPQPWRLLGVWALSVLRAHCALIAALRPGPGRVRILRTSRFLGCRGPWRLIAWSAQEDRRGGGGRFRGTAASEVFLGHFRSRPAVRAHCAFLTVSLEEPRVSVRLLWHWPSPASPPRGEQPRVLDEVQLQVHLSRDLAPAAARLPGPPPGCTAASCPH